MVINEYDIGSVISPDEQFYLIRGQLQEMGVEVKKGLDSCPS